MQSLGIRVKYLSLKINKFSSSCFSSQSHQSYRRALWEAARLRWRRWHKANLGAREHYGAAFLTTRTTFSDDLHLCTRLLFAVANACTRRIKVIEDEIANSAKSVLKDSHLLKTHHANALSVQRAPFLFYKPTVETSWTACYSLSPC